MTCRCGSAAKVRLKYQDGGREVRSSPKCGRCADRTAFILLRFTTQFVFAKVLA